ncbi:TPA: hypothetical protein UYJ79_002040 [Enterococcus faecalis]|nr:hypothetical protein [Enterococcus faecalis]HEL7543828.1 hypothetical protein [Enterococcus faecalis]HEL7552032.1 hypothetical protein [Enterococcus faecalis]
MSNQKNFGIDPIENYLLSLGVSKATIEANKAEISKSDSDYYYFYDFIPNKKAKDVLIPLEKVKSIRSVSGYSWFTIFRYLSEGIPKELSWKEFNLKPNNFNDLMKIIHQGGKEAYTNFCKKTYDIDFTCLEKNGEIEYFRTEEGNHRTVIAKNLGIAEINATTINYYKFNPIKYRQYSSFNKLYSELLNNAEKAGFKILKDYSQIGIFLDKKYSYGYWYYERINYNEFPVFSYDYEKVERMLLEMQQIRNKYCHINEKSAQYQKYLTRLPLFAKKVLRLWLTRKPYEDRTNNELALLVALSEEIKKSAPAIEV